MTLRPTPEPIHPRALCQPQFAVLLRRRDFLGVGVSCTVTCAPREFSDLASDRPAATSFVPKSPVPRLGGEPSTAGEAIGRQPSMRGTILTEGQTCVHRLFER